MTEELARIGITLPNDLLIHFDEAIINNGHSSRSDAIRDALRRYIQHHEWMNDVKGERVGIFEIIYNLVKKGLPATIENILSESNEIFLSSIRVHLNSDYYMRIISPARKRRTSGKAGGKVDCSKGSITYETNNSELH